MDRRGGFTVLELLVVVAIIVLMLSIVVPSLHGVRNQAEAVVCQSNLNQWRLAWTMYLSENNRKFPEYLGFHWMANMEPYYAGNQDLLYCPTTTKTRTEGAEPRYAIIEDEQGNRCGSYALNEWIYDSDHRDVESYWRHTRHRGLNNIPVMGDAAFRSDGQPYETDEPPPYDGAPRTGVGGGGDEMRIFCIDRHNGTMNILFMDWSAKRVGLRQLWKLKWHRNFDTDADPPVWPEWMQDLPAD
ncbi:MAG: type II secretion system protein [Phycisphaerales bacterium]|nr:MAG: type II secretion system protein [Phycisphaerales bacterium]